VGMGFLENPKPLYLLGALSIYSPGSGCYPILGISGLFIGFGASAFLIQFYHLVLPPFNFIHYLFQIFS